MTRFGYVMTTYFAMLVFIGLAFVRYASESEQLWLRLGDGRVYL